MAYLQIQCGAADPKTAPTTCAEKFGATEFPIVLNAPFSFATETDALDRANWQDLITGAATPQGYPFPKITLVTDNSGDATVEDVSRKETVFIKDGQIIMQYRLNQDVSLGLTQQLRKFNGKTPNLFFVTENQYIQGTSVDGTVFSSIPSTQFYVTTVQATLDTAEHTLVTIGFEAEYWADRGVWVNPSTKDTDSWLPTEELFGNALVTLSEITSTTASIVFGVNTTFNNIAVAGDPYQPVTLDLADFTFDATLASEISTLVNNEDGTFTLTPTATFTVGAHTIDLNAPSATGHRYAQNAQLSITVA